MNQALQQKIEKAKAEKAKGKRPYIFIRASEELHRSFEAACEKVGLTQQALGTIAIETVLEEIKSGKFSAKK